MSGNRFQRQFSLSVVYAGAGEKPFSVGLWHYSLGPGARAYGHACSLWERRTIRAGHDRA